MVAAATVYNYLLLLFSTLRLFLYVPTYRYICVCVCPIFVLFVEINSFPFYLFISYYKWSSYICASITDDVFFISLGYISKIELVD